MHQPQLIQLFLPRKALVVGLLGIAARRSNQRGAGHSSSVAPGIVRHGLGHAAGFIADDGDAAEPVVMVPALSGVAAGVDVFADAGRPVGLDGGAADEAAGGDVDFHAFAVVERHVAALLRGALVFRAVGKTAVTVVGAASAGVRDPGGHVKAGPVVVAAPPAVGHVAVGVVGEAADAGDAADGVRAGEVAAVVAVGVGLLACGNGAGGGVGTAGGARSADAGLAGDVAHGVVAVALLGVAAAEHGAGDQAVEVVVGEGLAVVVGAVVT